MEENKPQGFSAPYGLLRVRLDQEYPIVYENAWLRARLPRAKSLRAALHPRQFERMCRAIGQTGGNGEVEMVLEPLPARDQAMRLLVHGRVQDGFLDAVLLDLTARRSSGDGACRQTSRDGRTAAAPVATFEVNFTSDELLETDADWWDGRAETYTGLLHHMIENALYPQHRAQLAERFDRGAVLRAYAKGRRVTYSEYVGINRAKQPIWLEATMTLLRNRMCGDVYGLLHIQNVDQRKRQEQELRRRAERDELTGVLNRRTVRARIDGILSESAESGRRCAIMMVDLDNFKQINDTYGHVQGDTVLSDFAGRLRGIFRENDLIGRLGGDEFVILMRDIPNKESVVCKAAQVCGVVSSACDAVSGTVGVAFSPDDGLTFDELYHKADLAMYRAKRQGKNCCAAYDRALDAL